MWTNIICINYIDSVKVNIADTIYISYINQYNLYKLHKSI
jgi:hypothetical protein